MPQHGQLVRHGIGADLPDAPCFIASDLLTTEPPNEEVLAELRKQAVVQNPPVILDRTLLALLLIREILLVGELAEGDGQRLVRLASFDVLEATGQGLHR